MTKTYLGSAAAIIGLAGMAVASSTPAQAGTEHAATVTQDSGCTGFIPTSDGGIGELLRTNKGFHRVETRNGGAILSCQFDIPDALKPAGVEKAEGFDCKAGEQTTNDSSMVATPGGRALLFCKVNG